jgi:hypothetical protein
MECVTLVLVACAVGGFWLAPALTRKEGRLSNKHSSFW